MSVAAPSPPPSATGSSGETGEANAAPAGESCPLCGTPLEPEQEWCLHCGAAARTRLAASSSWKAPLIAVAVIAALALAVLAASLVKLAGDSNSRPRATVVLINTPAAATPTTAVPGTATTTPSTATPPAGSSSAGPSTPAQAPTTPLPARARLSAPAKKRLAELEARLRKSKSPVEQLRLRRLKRRVLAGQ